jgi:Flp pilus assembly pilin Flp
MMNILLARYTRLVNRIEREEGQDLIEYGLILFLIAIAAVASIEVAGDSIATFWQEIATTISGL